MESRCGRSRKEVHLFEGANHRVRKSGRMSGGITIGGISVGQKKADISDLPKYVQGIVKMAARKAEEKAARKQHHDICYAQEKAMRRALKVTEATRRAKALGMPLPANRIYSRARPRTS